MNGDAESLAKAQGRVAEVRREIEELAESKC